MSEFPTVTTTKILDALRASNDDATWRLFFDRFSPLLRAVAFRIGVPRQQLDDVVQDTLLEFVRDLRAGKYIRGQGRMRHYLKGIARHRAIDAIRRTIRDKAAAGDTFINQLPEESAFDQAWDAEDQLALRDQALAELRASTKSSPENLKAFELMIARPLTPEQIAAECNISVDQVYKIKSRLGEKFREIYDRLRHEMYQD